MAHLSVENKVKKAIVNVAFYSPFFSVILYNLKIIKSSSIPTCETDGFSICYNPDFIQKVTTEELTGIFIHELSHIIMFHHTRMGNRPLKKWNRACDYAINPLVLAGNYALPVDALIKDEYKGMSAEKIYTLLPEEKETDSWSSCGEVLESPLTQEEAEQQVREWVVMAKAAGCQLSNIEQELIKGIADPVIDWRVELANHILPQYKYEWQKPSRRSQNGIYLPSLVITPMLISIAIDTSGSMSSELLSELIGQINILKETCLMDAHLLQFDTAITNSQYIDQYTSISTINIKSRGGTNFDPPITWLSENKIVPKCLIYMTDGECDNYAPMPTYPVIWLTSKQEMKPPYGTVIPIDIMRTSK